MSDAPEKTRPRKPRPAKAAAPDAAGVPPEEQWTIDGGKPIPPEVKHLIPFRLTDQGIEQLNASGDRSGPRVEVRDSFDRAIDARTDAGDGLLEPWLAPDPVQEALKPYQEPGFRLKLLSEDLNNRRGLRGFEVVKKPNGDPASMGGRMVIGRMPEDMAQQRNEFYRKQGTEAVEAKEEQLQANQEKILSEGKAVGIRPLRAGEILHDAEDGDRVATVGVRSKRGNTAHFTE